MPACDAVVVGGGLGGLSAAALLATEGRRVVVFERGKAAGGYAHAFRRGPYTFDPAIHVMPEARYASNLLAHLGVGDDVRFVPTDALFRVVYPDLTVTLPFGVDNVVAAIAEHFPAERSSIEAFLALKDAIFDEASHLPHQLQVSELDAARQRFPNLFTYRGATVEAVTNEYFEDPRAAALITSSWPYLGLPPSSAGYIFFSQQLGALMDGAYQAEGSFETLVAALLSAIERNGGEVVLESDVEEIVLRNGSVEGVRLAGGARTSAPVVISNADAAHTLERLVGAGNLPATYVKKLRRLRPSLSACLLFAATTLPLEELGATHETFVFAHWEHDDTYRDIEDGRLGGVCVCVPSLADRSLAPANEHLVKVMALARHGAHSSWRGETNRLEQEMIDVVESVYPGFREELVFAEVATPATLEAYTGNQQGAAYGWENSPRQTGSGRLSHETPIEGLYLAGHWTHEGTGCLRALVSGEATARLILQRDGDDDLPSFRPSHVPSPTGHGPGGV